MMNNDQNSNKTFKPSELILNEDGSIYHLGLHPEELATTIITVGDPKRVEKVSAYFDRIETVRHKREFVTHTGYIGEKRLTVLSTGMGTDNIDIALNELDALANIDLSTRTVKEQHTPLKFIRIGTTGGLRAELATGSFLVSNYAIGLEGLMLFYKQQLQKNELDLKNQFSDFLNKQDFNFPIQPTFSIAGNDLLEHFQSDEWTQGITLTATGFYAPQNRILRAASNVTELFDTMQDFSFKNLNITNLEMETAGIYGLANLLGHQAISLNAVMANRVHQTFAQYPAAVEQQLIGLTIDAIVSNDL